MNNTAKDTSVYETPEEIDISKNEDMLLIESFNSGIVHIESESGDLYTKKITKDQSESKTVEFPDFPPISPSLLKSYNREVIRKIPESERNELNIERQILIIKKYRNEITESETKRLRLIEWKLDRIDDAQYGEEIDKLQLYVKMHEDLAKDIEKIIDLSEGPGWRYIKSKKGKKGKK